MAFRRKRIKKDDGTFHEHPKKCFICKKYKAYHTMHGGLVSHYENYGGKPCCNDCVPLAKQKEADWAARDKSGPMSEGEHQAYGHLFK